MLRRSPTALLAATRLMLAVTDYKILAQRVDNAAACAALFPQTKEGIAALVEAAKSQTATALEAITTATDDAARTYDNTVRAADLSAANLSVAACSLALVKDTHVDKDIRAAAAEAVVELEKLSIDAFSSNKALYKAFKAVPQGAIDAATAQRKYWYDEKMLDFKSKGLELPDDKFAEVVALRKRLAELDTKFSENIAEDKRTIVVPIAECAGVPQPILDGCKKVDDDKSYELGMDYPTYFGVMKNCTVASTRKAMQTAFENRAHPANLPVLHEVIQLRHQLATKLGFASYAHLDLCDKMAKTPETAQTFVESLFPKMSDKWALERQKLIDAGLPESVELVGEKKDTFRSFDLAFVMNKYKQDRLSVDEQAIREYFPLESTVKALYDIYENFFDISFESVKGQAFWHPEVEAMAVTDKRTGKLLGHIILDLFPREGKFSHACCHGILPPLQHDDGNFAPAVSVVVANFPKATADRPALFLHDDVETFFHEFGHAIHYLWGRGEMATTAGYNVKMDFVELPSQMLEEWMWDPKILKGASRHYKTGEPLPDDLIAKKIESKRAFSGRDGLRQLAFGHTALTFFNDKMGAVDSPDAIDTTAAQTAIDERIMTNVQRNPDGHFQCSFGHLMGYGACYYGYMWSKVFALDVFREIKAADGLLDPTVGRKYADTILGCGGGRDPNESLRMFLGRDPKPDAFFEDMGL
uniref:Peptidase M3A/M3B catalytic domain-containing protein n=1 Tax=Neobodo designis TaxID=312471 RepID=A0A7S1Q596_NEODS|mmetsp:Transcript_3144/g.9794  ORF Transcript_3144/g.9794 Transcript_3144/m.9794 type:complete len:701 (+) Transcript_3144:90-2192(+)|eukprot:CAMPEP_0174834764 /NCGR_PEP_ID=MMETSP1114-20130205/5031_1 /TAXON_ID=312471 /ORGANISM="Neobodo designis, Strain CCAP 1951/1" /LENGTH=700 /DNA_ID=CAMNT_0016068693 /DNA_START=88 /DNA_END=2190 /DNA_ORIENTATION=-